MEIKRKVAQSDVKLQTSSNENQKVEIRGQKFTESTEFIVLMFFVFFPYALYLLWKRNAVK